MKKLLTVVSVLLIVCLAFGGTMLVRANDLPTIPLTASQTTRVAGDVNRDNRVNLLDVTLILRKLAGGWNVVIYEAAADVNADHSVDLKDAVLVRRAVAGGWNVTLV